MAFSNTNGKWQYVTTLIELPLNCIEIELSASNDSAQNLWLDCVLLVPFGTEVTATSRQQNLQLLRASMNAAGQITRTIYDAAQRVLATVGSDNQLQELDVRYLSLQGSSNGQFDDANPNAELTLKFYSGGSAESFLDNGEWQQRWRPNNTSLWQVNDGVLQKTSNAADNLCWQGTTQSVHTSAFFLELQLPQSVQNGLGLFIADQKIVWSNGWQWLDSKGATVQIPLASPTQIASQWLLILTGDKLLFFANGQLIFSHDSEMAPTTNVVFNSGTNPLSVLQLMAGFNPGVAVYYNDGAARQRQVHQLHDSDAVLVESIYDSLDRQIAITRTGRASFAQGSASQTLQYRSSFVNVSAFLQSREQTGIMQGDIAAYYGAGQYDGEFPRSDDQGYPYTGTRYESAAIKRIIETGQPGQLLAIQNQATSSANDRHTTQITYTQSKTGDPVAANQFLAQYVRTPGGTVGGVFFDTNQRTVATEMLATDGQCVAKTQALPSYFNTAANEAGTNIQLCMPNYFTAAPQQNSSSFVRHLTNDTLGNICKFSDSNTRETEFIMNGNGQLRFMRVPLESGENYFLYYRYDALGRQIEEGTVNAGWNKSLLESKVNDLNYPVAADYAVIARAYQYDGDGSNANNLGQLTAVVTYNPDSNFGDCTVQEQWQYDHLGRICQASLTLSGAITHTVTVSYAYNNLNQLTAINFSDASLPNLCYQYNDLGQTIAIGTEDNPQAIASYEWTVDGQLQSVNRGVLSDAFAYDSASNLLQHSVKTIDSELFQQSFGYNVDSKTIARSTRFNFSDLQKQQDWHLEYDNNQWLQKVSDSDNHVKFNVSQFDANGNSWQWQTDTIEFTAKYQSGTDQLIQVNTEQGFHYRQNGNADVWRGMQISYHPTLNTVASVSQSNPQLTVRYARGINNVRVLRQTHDSTRITLYGAGNLPLLIWENGQAQVCVWGCNGLEAVNQQGKWLYPINDAQNTIWAVVDEQSRLIAAFDYSPYGEIINESGDLAESWLFRYAGKEWDKSLGLYDFGARLYDPKLLRFISIEDARQYASPYLFAGNNPFDIIDPSGNLGFWGKFGIAMGMAAVTGIGLGLSMVSGGASLAISAQLNTILLTLDMSAELGTFILDEATLQTLVTNAVAANAVAANAVAANVAYVTMYSISGALMSAGMNGFSYDMKHGRDFSGAAFGKSIGLGAATGAVSGVFTGLASMPAVDSFKLGLESMGKKIAFNAATRITGAVIAANVTTLMTDAITDRKPTAGQLMFSSLTGVASGLVSATTPSFTDIKGVTVFDFAKEKLGTSGMVISGTAGVLFGTGLIAAYTWYSNSQQQNS